MSQKNSVLRKDDLIINYSFLFVAAVSGLATTGLISRLFGLSALGFFNLLLGLYFAYSQIAVFGIHNSINYVAAKDSGGRNERSLQLSSAMSASFFFGTLSAAVFAVSGPLWSSFFSFPDLSKGMVYAAPALIFFSWNKILLAYFNAIGRQMIFGIGQGLRGIFLLLSILVIYFLRFPAIYLPYALSVAECLLFLILLLQLQGHLNHKGWFEISRIQAHIAFGMRGLWSNVFMELNSKVDVLMLGYFSSPHVVGIYSLASTFIEGFQLLFTTLRSLLHPKVVQEFETGGRDFVHKLFRPWKRRVYALTLPITLLACGTFYLILPLISADPSAKIPAFITFSILALGIYLASGYLIFSNIFYQIGKPGLQSLFSACLVAINFLLNLILIPYLQSPGAAMATAIATVSIVFLLPYMARRYGPIDLGSRMISKS